MAIQDVAVVIVRGIALQFFLVGTTVIGTFAIAKLHAAFTDKPDVDLDNNYFVVTDTGTTAIAIIFSIVCFALAAALLYWSTPLARWLTKGFQ